MASVHAIAAASDDYDATMESLLCGELAERPDYWSRLWPSSLVISQKLATAPEFVRGQSVVELGSGLGACSVCAALMGARAAAPTEATQGKAAWHPASVTRLKTVLTYLCSACHRERSYGHLSSHSL
eukprot:459040-Pleurochrysis_carterae.AAC.5